MKEPAGWRLSCGQLKKILKQAGRSPANARELTQSELQRLAQNEGLVSRKTLTDLPDKVLETILCKVAENEKLGTVRNDRGPSSLFSLACVHPKLDRLLCQNSDIWRSAWAMYLTHAKETDIRDHNTSSLSARNKLRLLSYTGCQCCPTATKTRKVYWAWGVRLCDSCFESHGMEVKVAEQQWEMELPTDVLESLPVFTKKMYNPNYWMYGLPGPEWEKQCVFKPHLGNVLRRYADKSTVKWLGSDYSLPPTAFFRDRAAIAARACCDRGPVGLGLAASASRQLRSPLEAATLEEAMADLAARNLPPAEATRVADAIVARFLPDATAAAAAPTTAAAAAPATAAGAVPTAPARAAAREKAFVVDSGPGWQVRTTPSRREAVAADTTWAAGAARAAAAEAAAAGRPMPEYTPRVPWENMFGMSESDSDEWLRDAQVDVAAERQWNAAKAALQRQQAAKRQGTEQKAAGALPQQRAAAAAEQRAKQQAGSPPAAQTAPLGSQPDAPKKWRPTVSRLPPEADQAGAAAGTGQQEQERKKRQKTVVVIE